MNKKEEIYRLLIAGNSAFQIAEKLGIDKGNLSRFITQLEREGLIQCIGKKSKPKQYIKTPKKLLRSKLYKNLQITPSKLSRVSGRLCKVKVQKSSFIFNILSVSDVERKWDKEYEWNKGVLIQQYIYPFENIGSVIFRRFISKNINRLIIILPSILLHKDEVNNAEKILQDYAMKAGAWFQKRFKMRLALPELCQKPHYAVSIREPELIDAVEYGGTFTVGKIMVDKSPPDRIHEFESTDHRDIVNYLDVISKIKNLEENQQNIMLGHESITNILGEHTEHINILFKVQKEQSIVINKIIKLHKPKQISLLISEVKTDEGVDVT